MRENEWIVICEGNSLKVRKTEESFSINEREVDFTLLAKVGKSLKVRFGNHITNVFVNSLADNRYEVWIGHHCLDVVVEDSRAQLFRQFVSRVEALSGQVIVRAPMPGLVIKLEVKEGEEVHPGTGLVVLEAMKMENEIRSIVRGRIKKIEVSERRTVEKGQTMILIEIIQDK